MQEPLYSTLEKLIIKNNIQVNKEELKLQFSSHPSYPSLHALTGVLDHFNIPNLVLRVNASITILEQLPNHFIAQVVTDKGEDLVLVEKKKTGIKITTSANKHTVITEPSFLEKWNGLIVVIEKDSSIEETVSNPFKGIIKWSFVIFSILLISFMIKSYSSIFEPVHFLLSITGIIISVFIVKQELGLQSTEANSFCNLSEKTSCDAVLNSKGATLFGLFKLSDTSIVVFASYCLYWILSFANGSTNSVIMPLIALSAIPFVLYSIYYQYKVVQKWCPLCLAIASVLVLQCVAVPFSGFVNDGYIFNLSSTLLLLSSFVVGISAWSFLKPILKRKISLEASEIEHYKFKKNFSLFNTFYKESDSLESLRPIDNEIVLGSLNAPLELVLVTSPFCYYCKKAHSDIEKILKQAHNKIKVIIRFNVGVEDKDNDLYKIASQLIHIYNTQGEAACLRALDTVYKDDVDLKKWTQNQNIQLPISYDAVLKEQEYWCTENNINFTPALYINNRAFPKDYERTDLLYFIDDLIEQQEAKPKNAEYLIAQ